MGRCQKTKTIKRPFFESDTDKSDSAKKRKLIAINSKVPSCIKQDSIMNDVKSSHSFNHAEKILMPSSVLLQ